MAKYELKFQQDNTTLNHATNLNWDLPKVQSDFIIQFRAHLEHDQNNNKYSILPQPHVAAAAATTTKMLLHVQEASSFLTYDGMSQFLTDILEDEGGLAVDADGKFLWDGGLQLLRPDGSRMLAFPQSVRIYTLSKLVDCVLRYAKWLSFSPRNRFVKFVPISIDLAMHES